MKELNCPVGKLDGDRPQSSLSIARDQGAPRASAAHIADLGARADHVRDVLKA